MAPSSTIWPLSAFSRMLWTQRLIVTMLLTPLESHVALSMGGKSKLHFSQVIPAFFFSFFFPPCPCLRLILSIPGWPKTQYVAKSGLAITPLYASSIVSATTPGLCGPGYWCHVFLYTRQATDQLCYGFSSSTLLFSRSEFLFPVLIAFLHIHLLQ